MVVAVAVSESVGSGLGPMVRVQLVQMGHLGQMDRTVRKEQTVPKLHSMSTRSGFATEPVVLGELRNVTERMDRSLPVFHSPRFGASRRFAARGCTSIHRCSFPAGPHQTRIRSTASSLWGVDSSRTPPDS